MPFVFVDIFALLLFRLKISELKLYWDGAKALFEMMRQKIFAKFANSKFCSTKRIDLFSPLRKVKIFRHNKSNTRRKEEDLEREQI